MNKKKTKQYSCFFFPLFFCVWSEKKHQKRNSLDDGPHILYRPPPLFVCTLWEEGKTHTHRKTLVYVVCFPLWERERERDFVTMMMREEKRCDRWETVFGLMDRINRPPSSISPFFPLLCDFETCQFGFWCTDEGRMCAFKERVTQRRSSIADARKKKKKKGHKEESAPKNHQSSSHF